MDGYNRALVPAWLLEPFHPMSDSGAKATEPEMRKGSWGELFRDGRGLYCALVIGGNAMHATQILVIAIIMPTIVADVGGAVYYTWAAMLYTIGSIVGASSTGAVWSKFGARRSYALAALTFAAGTAVCALAPDMGTLIAARGVQGWAGGLVSGSSTTLITSLFDARLRTRIIAMSQGTFTICHLGGPIVGGVFAAMHWWRGSFWLMVPFMLAFAAIAYFKIPDRLGTAAERGASASFPFFRLATLAVGVCCIAATGPADSAVARAFLVIAAVVLVGTAFRLDHIATNNLFPVRALSFNAPIGLALWILTLHAMTQTSVTLFLPLLLQVVHGVSPLFINFVTIVISFGWTVGTFSVSGWSGARERVALWSGPLLAFASLICLTVAAQLPGLELLTLGAFVMGLGIGVYNVHLVARAMESAAPGEQRTTAAALTSVRSLGTAFGAAIAGVIANAAGLGNATEPVAVGHAVTTVYMFCWIPLALAVMCMFRFVRIGLPKPVPVAAAAD
jgi:MFS family permease